jgi:hypothetical protein
MTATLDEETDRHQHGWALVDVEFVEVVGQVSQFGCECGAVWFR